MTIKDLVATSSLAQRFGVKAVVYSGPGLGKTPLLTTAPNPVICFTEPGFLSVAKWEGPAYEAYTYARIREFWLWAIGSQEARQFHTFCVDSVSQIAEIILAEEKPKHKDGRKAYGEMFDKTMEIMNWIYFAKGLNALLIAKEDMKTEDNKFRPYFPGKELNVKIPHLFDSVWRLENVPTPKGNVRCMRTRESAEAFARDRAGKINPATGLWQHNLDELEPADISHLFQKSLR